MYLAYIRDDIPIGTSKNRSTTGRAVEFTQSKKEYANCILILEKMSSNWYIHKASSLIYHKEWLECLNYFNANIYIAEYQEDCYRIISFDESSNMVKDMHSDDMLIPETFFQYYNFNDSSNTTVYRNKTSVQSNCSNCNKQITICVSRIIDDKTLCNECFDKLYTDCDGCNCLCLKDKLTKKGTKYFCDKCKKMVGQCHICSEWYKNTNMMIKRGQLICTKCKDELYKYCSDCKREVYVKEIPLVAYPDSSKSQLCPACYYNRKSKPIQCYTFKPLPVFKGNKGCGQLYLGLEIEMECDGNRSDSIARYVRDETNAKCGHELIYCKSDSSVPSGFEVVTHPMNWEWLKKNRKKFTFLFETAKEFGCKSGCDNNACRCGIHIHMSRDAFTHTMLLKFTRFIYENKPFIYKISERKDKNWFEQYCSLDGLGKHQFVHVAKTNKKYDHRKHSALSFASPDTIELRIFDGTIDVNTLYKDMEFCIALYEYVIIHKFNEMKDKIFVKYLEKYKKEYPNLYKFLNKE